MPTAKKITEVAELTKRFQRANAAVLLHYRELKVGELSDLRRKLRPSNIEVKISKNTLLRIATANAGKTGLDKLFAGPTAVAFIYGSEPQGAKAVSRAPHDDEAARRAARHPVGSTPGISRSARRDPERRHSEPRLCTLRIRRQTPGTAIARYERGLSQWQS